MYGAFGTIIFVILVLGVLDLRKKRRVEASGPDPVTSRHSVARGCSKTSSPSRASAAKAATL